MPTSSFDKRSGGLLQRNAFSTLHQPVGAADRVAEAAWRNSALVLAATFLMGGVAIAFWLSVGPNRDKADALTVGEEGRKANQELAENIADLEWKNGELKRKADRLEAILTTTCLSALATQPGPLRAEEAAALRQMAAQRGQPPCMSLIRAALTRPDLTRRLRARAEYFWQAALGLDLQRRDEAERLLLAALRLAEPEQRLDLALAAAALGEVSPQTAGLAAQVLTTSMTTAHDPGVIKELAEGLLQLVTRMEPKEAAAVCGIAAATLEQAPSETKDRIALANMAHSLPAVPARLQPRKAVAAVALTYPSWRQDSHLGVSPRRQDGNLAAKLIEAMRTTTNKLALASLGRDLSALAGRMAPEEAAATAATLLDAMNKSTNPDASFYLARGLSDVAARMAPKEAAAAAATLLQAMSKTTDPDALRDLAHGLSALAARMAPKEAAAVCSTAAGTLFQAMRRTTDSISLSSLARDVSALSVRMAPTEAAAACGTAAGTLVEAMGKTTDDTALFLLARGLSALSARMAPKEAAAANTTAAAMLLQAMNKTRDPAALVYLAHGLSELAARLPAPLLVDLLADPLCVGAARRPVLDQLGHHYGRHFADQWDFARFEQAKSEPRGTQRDRAATAPCRLARQERDFNG